MQKILSVILSLIVCMAMLPGQAFADDVVSDGSDTAASVDISAVKLSLSVSASATKVKLSWNKADGVSGAAIYRAAKKDGSYKKIGETEKNSYTDKGLKFKKTYYYKIRAYKVSDSSREYGAYSDIKSAKTRLAKTKITEIKPEIEYLTTGESFTNGYFKLKWNKVDGASGYQVAVKLRSETKWRTKYKDTGKYHFCYKNGKNYKKYDCFTKTNSMRVLCQLHGKWDYKVRAYRLVDGKRVYGPWSDKAYRKLWTNAELKKGVEDYCYDKMKWEFRDYHITPSYEDVYGKPINPWDGYVSWGVMWPVEICRYDDIDRVAKEMMKKKIREEKKWGYTEKELIGDEFCVYIEDSGENWVKLYIMSPGI